MPHKALALLTACLIVSPFAAEAASRAPIYFPDRFDWQHKKPEEVGMNAGKLDEAVKSAIANENPLTKNMVEYLATTFGADAPMDRSIGPTKDRGPAAGIITRHGYIVAEWGDPSRIDMTFSVSKTFVTTTVALAWQKGLIKDTNDFVRDYMPAGVDYFDAPHNGGIRWEHMLRQTSDWQGTLWGKPDWVDRPGGPPETGMNRKLWEPGTHYKYNDVRVNLLALASMDVWREPLPDVIRDEIMEPIGASSTRCRYGYDNSWVDIGGHKMPSVAAGGHWGGGMQINAYDMARFGYLFLRDGKWKDRQLVSQAWIDKARTPGSDNTYYGDANWYLNTDRQVLPSASATSFWVEGNGNNIISIDHDNDIVAVVRWISTLPALNDVVGKMLASIDQPEK
jgi:CubicO group peptidase (beta-lactamase class C family)